MDSLENSTATYPSIWQSVGIAAIVVLMTAVCSPLLAIGTWIGDEAAAMLYYLTAFGLVFTIVNSVRKQKLGASHYNFRISPWWLVFPLVAGSIALLFGVIAPMQSLIPMPEAMTNLLKAVLSQTRWPTFVYFVLAAPLLEELVFRGIMLDGLLQRYKPLTSIIVSSFLFGLVHLNPWQFVTGFVMGCFLGWVYYRSRSVGACVSIHMAANFSGYLCRMLYDLGNQVEQQSGAVESNGRGPLAITLNALLLLVFAASVFWLRREFDKVAPVTPETAAAALL